jgi:hypothetical protein
LSQDSFCFIEFFIYILKYAFGRLRVLTANTNCDKLAQMNSLCQCPMRKKRKLLYSAMDWHQPDAKGTRMKFPDYPSNRDADERVPMSLS